MLVETNFFHCSNVFDNCKWWSPGMLGISYKVDGKTSIFAHGLEFKLDKIGLTFKWKEEQKIRDFFHHKGNAVNSFGGFKYFDTAFEGMKVRCMFYGDYPGDDTE
jgi:hypothetical protein